VHGWELRSFRVLEVFILPCKLQLLFVKLNNWDFATSVIFIQWMVLEMPNGGFNECVIFKLNLPVCKNSLFITGVDRYSLASLSHVVCFYCFVGYKGREILKKHWKLHTSSHGVGHMIMRPTSCEGVCSEWVCNFGCFSNTPYKGNVLSIFIVFYRYKRVKQGVKL